MRSLLIVVIACCTIIPKVFAQQGKIDRADKKFNEYAYVDARKIYIDLAKKGYESAEIFEKIADSYYFNGDYDEASGWYGKLVEKYPNETSPEYYFRYAQSLRALQNYELADTMMSTFNDLKGEDTRAELFEQDADYLRNISYKKSKYTVEKLKGINSRFSDFAPSEYEGKLLFATARDTGGFRKAKHKWNNQAFLDLYQASYNEGSARFEEVGQFSKELNSKFHESTTAFTADGKTVYFTRNNYNEGTYKKSKGGTNKLKIYKSRKKGDSWSVPTEMPFNSDEYSTAHPTISADGTKLYFASDMPGTIGLSDIWVVSVDSTDVVGVPKNLGRPVNTEGRETFPYSSKEGSLYFASDGHPGFGGLDIFVTTPKSETHKESEVENIGEPVNGSYDDFTFIVNDETMVGYFASNRKKGKGSDDIYRFTKEEIACKITLEGVITDIETGEPIPGATVKILGEGQAVIGTVIADSAGKYTTPLECEKEYIVRAEKELYGPAEAAITTPDVTGTLTRDLELKKEVIEVKKGDDLTKSLNLNPIYFDLDKFNIRPDAAMELEKVISVMKSYPEMVIDVRSHTDSRSSDAYNLKLSDNRAKSTIAYIVSQGIEQFRIAGKGYGESQLLNRCSDGVKCSETEHQLNRRSEFIVISY